MLRSLFSISKKKIAFVILVILLLQIDNPLSKESKSLLDKVERTKSSQAYIYLVGLSASPEEDPLVVGRQQYEEFDKEALDSTYQIQAYSNPSKLSLPDVGHNCNAWQENCLSSLFDDDIDMELLLTENQILINRVKQLHNYNDYKTLTSPTISERLPEYRYLSWANRLDSYIAIGKFKAGETDDAVNTLQKNISILRRQLENQDNLIGKAIYISFVSEQIDILSIILSQVKNSAAYSSLTNLTLPEKSLELPMAREFAMISNMLKDLDGTGGFLTNNLNDIALPDWVIRMGFKPKMSINSLAPDFVRTINLTILEPDEFASALQFSNREESQSNKNSSSFITSINDLRNIEGRILSHVSGTPDYDRFITRIFDLDVKIKIFNQFHLNNQNVEMIKNPYFRDQHAFIDGNRVCVNAPLKEEKFEQRYIRCIQIQI